ncbi:MAG: hypothetical protein IJI25_08640 [Eubacterium sp.]|nr:hypothetical protein [Eubacterium sp.]
MDERIIALTQLILTDIQSKFRANDISPEMGVVIINAVAKQIQDVYITRSLLDMISNGSDKDEPADNQVEQEDADGNPA